MGAAACTLAAGERGSARVRRFCTAASRCARLSPRPSSSAPSRQVIKANDDLTPEHHQFFLYQMLRGLKYIHSAKVGAWQGAGWWRGRCLGGLDTAAAQQAGRGLGSS